MPKPELVFTEVMDDSDDEIEIIPYVKPPPVIIDLLESEGEDEDGKRTKKKSKKKKSKKDKHRDKENVRDSDSEVNDASQKSREIDNPPVVSSTSAERERNEGSLAIDAGGRRDDVTNELISGQTGDSEKSSESGNVARNDSVITEPPSVDKSPQVQTNLSDVREPGSRFEKCNDAQSKHATGANQSPILTGENMIRTESLPLSSADALVAPANVSPTQKRARTKERKSGGGGGNNNNRNRAQSVTQRTNEEIATFLTTLGIPLEPSVFDTPPPTRKRQTRKRKQLTESEPDLADDASSQTPTTSANAFISVTHESSPTTPKNSRSPTKGVRRKRQALDGDISNFPDSFSIEDLRSVTTNIQSNIFVPGDDDSNSNSRDTIERGSFMAVFSSSLGFDKSNIDNIIDAVARGECEAEAELTPPSATPSSTSAPHAAEEVAKANDKGIEASPAISSSDKTDKDVPFTPVSKPNVVPVLSTSVPSMTPANPLKGPASVSLQAPESSSSPPASKNVCNFNKETRKRQAIDGDISDFQISLVPKDGQSSINIAASNEGTGKSGDDAIKKNSSATVSPPTLPPEVDKVVTDKKGKDTKPVTDRETPSPTAILPVAKQFAVPSSSASASNPTALSSLSTPGSISMPTTSNLSDELAIVPYQGQNLSKSGQFNDNDDDACFPTTWTPHMKEFYGAPQNEDFEIDDVWFRLPENRRLWQAPNDMMPPPKSKRNYVRCIRCRQFGHFAKECREKVKPHICHMCGNEGHTSDFQSVSRRPAKCPFTRCLNCGQQLGQYNQQCPNCLLQRNPRRCEICNVIGHSRSICPDIWRRFHSVTTQEEFEKVMVHTEVTPLRSYRNTGSNKNRDIYKRNSTVFCCNCGQKGHTYYTCDENRYNPYHRNKPFAILEIPPSILAHRIRPLSVPSATSTAMTDYSSGFDVPYDVLSSRSIVMNAICEKGPAENLMEIETIQVKITNDLALKKGNVDNIVKFDGKISSKHEENENKMEVDDTSNEGKVFPCKFHPDCTNMRKYNEECYQAIMMRQCHVKLLKAQENGELKVFEEKYDVQISVINDKFRVHYYGKNAYLAEKDVIRFLWKDRRTSTENSKGNQLETSNAEEKETENLSKNVPVLTIDDDEEDDICILEIPSNSPTKSLPSSPSKGSSAIANLASAKKEMEVGARRNMEVDENLDVNFDDDKPLPTNSCIYTSFDQNAVTDTPKSSTSTVGKRGSNSLSFLNYESPLTGLSIGEGKELRKETDEISTTIADIFCVQKEGGVSTYPSALETPKEASHVASGSNSSPGSGSLQSSARDSNGRTSCKNVSPSTSRNESPSTSTSSTIITSHSSKQQRADGADPESLVFTVCNDKVLPWEGVSGKDEKSKLPPPIVPEKDDVDLEIIEVQASPKPASNIEVITLDDDEDGSVSTTPKSSSNGVAKSNHFNKITLLESEWKLVSDEFVKRDNTFNQIAKFFCVDLNLSKESSSIIVTNGSHKKRQMSQDNVVCWLECQSSKTPYTFLPRGYEEIRKAQKRAMKLGKKSPNMGNKNSIIARASRRSQAKMKKRALRLMDVQNAEGRDRDERKKKRKKSKNKSPNSSSDPASTPQTVSLSFTSTPVAVAGSCTAAPLYLPIGSTSQNHPWHPGFNKGATPNHSTPSSSKKATKSYPSPKKMKAKNKNHPPNTPTSGDKPRKKRYFNSFDDVNCLD